MREGLGLLIGDAARNLLLKHVGGASKLVRGASSSPESHAWISDELVETYLLEGAFMSLQGAFQGASITLRGAFSPVSRPAQLLHPRRLGHCSSEGRLHYFVPARHVSPKQYPATQS